MDAGFISANLEKADLRRTMLRGANLGYANLAGANVKTIKVTSDPNNTVTGNFTDLSEIAYFSKSQLETMDGDTGVILPEGWKHPAHWPKNRSPGSIQINRVL